MPSASQETAPAGSFVPKESASTRKIICMSSTGNGAWCRYSTTKGAFFTTLGNAAPGPEIFNFRPDCRSTLTTASMLWIRSTGELKYFTIRASLRLERRRHDEENSASQFEDSPFCGDCFDHGYLHHDLAGEFISRSTGVGRRARHA